MRVALDDAAPLYRDAPEAQEHRKAGVRQVLAFMREALPRSKPADRARVAEVMMMTMEAVGKSVSEDRRSLAEVDRIAVVTGDMFCAYLDRLNAPPHDTIPPLLRCGLGV